MKKFIILIIIFFQYTSITLSMTNKPYHHLDNGKFRNPEGSPARSENVKWSYSTFNKEKKKLDMTVPDEHVIKKNLVLETLNSIKNNDYIGWIGHATFLLKRLRGQSSQYNPRSVLKLNLLKHLPFLKHDSLELSCLIFFSLY